MNPTRRALLFCAPAVILTPGLLMKVAPLWRPSWFRYDISAAGVLFERSRDGVIWSGVVGHVMKSAWANGMSIGVADDGLPKACIPSPFFMARAEAPCGKHFVPIGKNSLNLLPVGTTQIEGRWIIECAPSGAWSSGEST